MDTVHSIRVCKGSPSMFLSNDEEDVYRSPFERSIRSSSDRGQPIAVPREVSTALKEKGLKLGCHGVVSWGPNSKHHPRRWPLLRKIYDTAVICFLEFFMTLISNTGSSIAPIAAAELGISKFKALVCFTTVYLFGQAIGGLIFPPIGESFGCRTIYLMSTFGFAAFSLVISVWPILPVVITGRFITGLLSAMPCVVATGSLENMWDMTSRTFVIHIWIAGAVVGLSLGPTVATFFSWRLIFAIAGLTTAITTLFCFGLRESRPSKVLREQVKDIAKLTKFNGLSLDKDDSLPTLKSFLTKSLSLPCRLFFTEPIIFFTSTMAATVFGVIYLFSECLAIVYEDLFDLTARQASLTLLAVNIGVLFSFLPRLHDIRIARLSRRRRIPLEPEDKLLGFYIAAPILAVGLWWFASTVPPLVHISPWASIGSLALIGFSVVEFDTVLSGYLCDTYAAWAASASAPMAFLRAVLSGVFPLFGEKMFHSLGAHIALFILAAIATAYCGVAVLFALYGKQIRERSPFAGKTWGATVDNEKLVAVEVSILVPDTCVVSSR